MEEGDTHLTSPTPNVHHLRVMSENEAFAQTLHTTGKAGCVKYISTRVDTVCLCFILGGGCSHGKTGGPGTHRDLELALEEALSSKL